MPFTTITTTVTTTVTLGSAGYTAPLRIVPTAAVAPSAYAATGLVATTSGYVLNEGLITAGGSGVGVDLSAGSLTNNGTITGGGGTIGGNAIDLAGGALINQGSITGGSATSIGGIGIDLMAGTLGNYGIISGGAGATGGTGVYLLTNTFTNYGTIEGGAGSTAGSGVVFKNGGTLRNFGVIGGADAVYFGTGASRLIFMPGASFTGAVVADAAYTNILELASAATSGTLTGGIGIQYQNFSTIAVDTAANWTLTGTSTLSAGTSLVVAGTLTNTGTLEGSVDVTTGSVVNRGSIFSVETGVSFAHGGTLTNAGYIAGTTDAVYFGTGAARLILDPHAIFTAPVVADSSFNNVLELASAATPGTLAGAFGTMYQGFGTVIVDYDARWTLAGTNTVAGDSSIVAIGTLIVAGSVANHGVIVGQTGGFSTSSSTAIYLASGSLVNSGTITGGYSTKPVTGGTGAVVTSGTLTNDGTILGGLGGPNSLNQPG